MHEAVKCIVVAGLPCAGKTGFLELCIRQGCCALEWSDVLYDDLGCPGIKDRTQWFRRIAQTVQEKGAAYYPRMIHSKLATARSPMHVVSGARNPAELGELLAMYAGAAVVWVEADATVRFHRAQTRARCDIPRSFEEFLRQDHEELAGGVAAIATRYVTHYLVNNGSSESYARSICLLLEHLQRGHQRVTGV